MKKLYALGLTLVIGAAVCACSSAQIPQKTKLSVLLYPFVPEYEHTAQVMKQRFEAENPTVEIVFGEQNWDYYKPKALDATYDVYELDGIFLQNFVSAGRLQVLDPGQVPTRTDVLKPAADSVSVDGATYGLPHWTCALFTFYFAQDNKLAAAATRLDLVSAIGSNHERGRGLLVDWKGHNTLAELYADCLLNLGLSPGETITALRGATLHPKAAAALGELIALSDTGTGRSDVAHAAIPPYYALEFAHGRGRALVGYSERMFHVLTEINHPTESTPVVDPRTIRVKLYNEGDASGVPLMWVDSFAIDKKVEGAKLDAARKFLTFAAQDETYRAILLPEGKAPQYLLPAYRSLFTDPAIIKVAPLYPDFLPGLDKATSLGGADLPKTLYDDGTLLDTKLPTNLKRQ